jgi:transcriptional regulator with XRE-family HTH domain
MQRIPAHVTLRSLRQARGLTSAALAGRLHERGVDVDPDHIIAVELGHRNAGNPLRVAWAEELGVNPTDIRFAPELRDLIAAADAANGTPDVPPGSTIAAA